MIKDQIEIEGDVRALTDQTRDTIQQELTRIVKGIEETFGVTCEFEFKKDYPALYNDPEFTSYVAETIKMHKLMILKVLRYVNLSHHQKILHFMLLNYQVHLFIQVLHLKMVIFTLTTILNLILMNHQCLLLLKQWALLF